MSDEIKSFKTPEQIKKDIEAFKARSSDDVGNKVEEQKADERPSSDVNVNKPGRTGDEQSLLSNHLVEESPVNPPTLLGLTTRNERIAEVLKLTSSDSQQFEKSYRMILSILDEFEGK